MDISSEHHVDASEQRPDGDYDYYYAYTEFVVAQNGLKAGFRLYDSERRIYVSWIELAGESKMVKWGESYGAVTFPRDSEDMKEMLRHFQRQYDITGVMAYDGPLGSYSEVAIEELA